MSGKRMIHESLFSSEELSDLSIQARYLFIATIVHADDEGRMRADPKYLKLKAFPFDECRVDDVRTWRNQLTTKLITVYEVDGKEYLFHPKWEKWQTLRKDRIKPSDCPKQCQPSGNQMPTKCQPSAAEVSKEVKEVREDKEVKGMTTKPFASLSSTSTTEDDIIDPYELMKKSGKVKQI